MMDIDSTSLSMYNYVVTAHKPTAVSHSVMGNFTGPNDVNLILAKSTRIEIHTLVSDGLQAVADVPIYGKISSLELFRPKGEPKDFLFISTERYLFCVLEYDANSAQPLITRATGNVADKIGRPADFGQLGLIDPEYRLIGLHLYDGLFKVMPIEERGLLGEAFNIRLEELSILDMVFLAGCASPTVALLYQDSKYARHVKTYVVNTVNKDFEDGPWNQTNLDNGASLLIAVPAPLGGCIILGENVITYITKPADGGKDMKTVSLKHTIIKAYGQIDAERYLLSDQYGTLYLLVLAQDQGKVVGLKLEVMGKTSVAAAITYLDAGHVFIGSRTGDSQVVKLHPTAVPGSDPPTYVEVVQSFNNLGPIVDFCVVDLERQGQGQIVTCSGVFQDGSLRIIRNGIGINEQATVELQGIKGIWSLRRSWADEHDAYLVLTFVCETRLLAFNNEEVLDEAALPGWDGGALTLYCGNTVTDHLLQVTNSAVRLINPQTGALFEWKPPAGVIINMASGSPSQVVVACGEGRLVYLEVTSEGLKEVASIKMDSEIACVDISPLSEGAVSSSLAAVGTWSMHMMLLRLPSLETVRQEELGGEVIPRSVLLASFEGINYCLCGLGDGVLLTWHLDGDAGLLSERKKVVLGTKPIQLKTFRSKAGSHVFAASDRPTIIYSSNKKLLYSNLNENEVNFMSSFNSAAFPNNLAIAKDNSMTIGTIDDIQKLHVRTVPLHEQPRRIAYHDASKVFGVFTMSLITSAGSYEDESSHLRVLDGQTFDVLASFAFEPMETGLALITTKFADDPNTYFVVGTAFVRPDEHEPNKGRILVLSYEDGKVQVVAEKEVKGAVYSLLQFQGKILSATNNRVQLYKWQQRDDGAKELVLECYHVGNVMALYLAARGDFIVVGDLMKSVSLLMYKADEGSLQIRAQDFNSTWLTALEMLDDDTFLAGENSFNMFVLRKNADAATDEDRNRLEVVGEYHLGEFINRFRAGSLVMRLPDAELSSIPTLLFGTVDGVIGVVASLPPQLFEFLNRLQTYMRKVVGGVGGFDHATWRSFSNERKVSECRNFIDGDLIEQLLDLPTDKIQQLASMMGDVTAEELSRRVEELTRLH